MPGIVAALLLYFAVQQVENNILVPKIQGDATNLHPAVVIFSLILGGAIAGLLGAILALPIAATLRDLYVYAFRRAGGMSPAEAATGDARGAHDAGPAGLEPEEGVAPEAPATGEPAPSGAAPPDDAPAPASARGAARLARRRRGRRAASAVGLGGRARDHTFSMSGAATVVSTTATRTALKRPGVSSPRPSPSVTTTIPTSPRGAIPTPTARALQRPAPRAPMRPARTLVAIPRAARTTRRAASRGSASAPRSSWAPVTAKKNGVKIAARGLISCSISSWASVSATIRPGHERADDRRQPDERGQDREAQHEQEDGHQRRVGEEGPGEDLALQTAGPPGGGEAEADEAERRRRSGRAWRARGRPRPRPRRSR